ncbi:MAG TPA: metallopeptidase family protein [Candidatus Elarobacter sp.]|jgi:predicted Zn-dependent protease with MMP-like domain
MSRSELSHADFEQVVEEALASLPARFAARMQNVVIAVEDEPTDDDLASLEPDEHDDEEGGELLGIFRGVALTDRSYDDAPLLPDEIAVFRGPINRVARNRAEAVREVRETVIHELGHYFGLDHDEMPY